MEQEGEEKVETLEGGNIDQIAAYFEKIPGLEFGKIKLCSAVKKRLTRSPEQQSWLWRGFVLISRSQSQDFDLFALLVTVAFYLSFV